MQKQFLVLGIGLVLSFAAEAEDWPVWRGTNHNSISRETGLKPSSKILWKKNVGEGYSAVSVYKGKLLTVGNYGGFDNIYCLDPKTGKQIWKSQYPCSSGGRFHGPRATPVTDGNKVWMLSRSGDLVCVNLSDGKPVWSKKVLTAGARNLHWGLSSSVLIFGNLAIVNVGAGGAAYNKNTGAQVWSNATGKGSYATPVPFKFKGKQYIVLFTGKTLCIVQAKNGKKAASFSWPQKHDINAADPIVSADGQYIFATSGYGTGRGALLKFNGRSLKKVWQNKYLKSQFSTPVLYKGVLYGSSGNVGERNASCAIDFKTGKKLWSGNLRFGSLMLAGDMLIYLDEKGKLHYLKANPRKQQLLKSVQVLRGGKAWTMPVLANGLLYCRNNKGDLVCLNLK
jgi:outer membrane protein assembly factor BamB